MSAKQAKKTAVKKTASKKTAAKKVVNKTDELPAVKPQPAVPFRAPRPPAVEPYEPRWACADDLLKLLVKQRKIVKYQVWYRRALVIEEVTNRLDGTSQFMRRRGLLFSKTPMRKGHVVACQIKYLPKGGDTVASATLFPTEDTTAPSFVRAETHCRSNEMFRRKHGRLQALDRLLDALNGLHPEWFEAIG